MEKQERINLAIKRVVTDLMDRVMEKVTGSDPFVEEVHRNRKPLYAALVPDEIFKGAHFERRFVTPFGGVWEKLADVVATEFHGDCNKGRRITGIVKKEGLRRIQEVLAKLEHPDKGMTRIKPDWETELAYIRAGKGEAIPVDVSCDIFIDSTETGLKHAFILNETFPTSRQAKVSKEKMLKLLAMSPARVDQVFYALPYDARDEKEEYAMSPPAKWFDMRADPSVLIGGDFWDLIGGAGTYENLVREVNSLGKNCRERIHTDYLGTEKPGGDRKNFHR